jgi:hypothetical protein
VVPEQLVAVLGHDLGRGLGDPGVGRERGAGQRDDVVAHVDQGSVDGADDEGGRAVANRPAADARPAALPALDDTLGPQRVVGGDDRAAAERQPDGQVTFGGQPLARREAAVVDGGAHGVTELAVERTGTLGPHAEDRFDRLAHTNPPKMAMDRLDDGRQCTDQFCERPAQSSHQSCDWIG